MFPKTSKISENSDTPKPDYYSLGEHVKLVSGNFAYVDAIGEIVHILPEGVGVTMVSISVMGVSMPQEEIDVFFEGSAYFSWHEISKLEES
jgi:hypothetical protein